MILFTSNGSKDNLQKLHIMFGSYLVLIRHGQSEWNKKNLFTGWVDVDLSSIGREEARQAGLELKKRQLFFDCAFSSALKRAIHTMEIVLEQMNLSSIPIHKSWQLNERHYGSLQGKNKQETTKKYGADQVQKWRRGFTMSPPPLKKNQNFKNNELYKTLKKIPVGESLKDTQQRVLPFWETNIRPQIQNKKTVLITAHGNSLRALIKNLENISDDAISSMEIQTGKPLIYKLNTNTEILSKEILDF